MIRICGAPPLGTALVFVLVMVKISSVTVIVLDKLNIFHRERACDRCDDDDSKEEEGDRRRGEKKRRGRGSTAEGSQGRGVYKEKER